MDLMWMFLALVITAYVVLNIMGSSMIRASEIHEDSKKNKLLLILWGVPVIGVFIVVRQINRDIKQNQERMEEEIAPAIREVADRLKILDADLSRKKSNSITDLQDSKNTKIH